MDFSFAHKKTVINIYIQLHEKSIIIGSAQVKKNFWDLSFVELCNNRQSHLK